MTTKNITLSEREVRLLRESLDHRVKVLVSRMNMGHPSVDDQEINDINHLLDRMDNLQRQFTRTLRRVHSIERDIS